MKLLTIPKTAVLKTLLGLCLFFGTGLAQPTLTSYRNATAALRSSVTAFPDDQVESLDMLRRAEIAFRPLGGALEPTLQRGLNETFSRAEEAIVNQSETDLQVQAAVLQGGFGRAVYQRALENAAAGDVASAQNLLGVLGQDLGLADAQFTGTSQDALQGAFEARLAARSLEELGTFGGDLGTRYRTLAQLYSYVFLVQDSPRLPPKTRDTVVGTIRSLVAERPTDEGISLLQSQLTGFAQAAKRTEAAAQADGGRQGGAQDTAASGTAGSGAPSPEAETDNEAFVPPVALTPGDVVTDNDTTDNATNNAQPTFLGSATAPNPPGATQNSTDQNGVTQNGAVQDGTIQNGTVRNAPGKTTTGDAAVPGVISALPFLTPDVLELTFAVAGLLALIGIVRLLFAPSVSPWRDAALTLLLLPVVLEGLVAFAGLLRPLVNRPWLEQVGPYSLFTSPVTQLVWVLLSAVAALCLVFGRRVSSHTDSHAAEAEIDDGRAEPVQDASHSQPQSQSQPQPQSTRSTPLTTGNLNWDEDF